MKEPLGELINEPHQNWEWYFDFQNEILFQKCGKIYKVYKESSEIRKVSRTEDDWYKAINTTNTLPQRTYMATVTQNKKRNHRKFSGWIRNSSKDRRKKKTLNHTLH